MKEVTLTPLKPKVWLEAEVIKPEVFAGKDIKAIRELEVFMGNQQVRLKDFFEVSGSVAGSPKEVKIVIAGDASRTKRIGQGMGAGEILIKGSAGMYVGARMTGGKIIVEGDADSFAGQQILGGELIIKGNASDYLGSSYRGDWRGMKGGVIVVGGNAGGGCAEFMLGGKIHIKGNCGPFAGMHMKKGLIVIEGNVPGRVGAQMTGGSIVVNGRIASLLPGFKFEKEEENIEIEGEKFEGRYLKYSGDHAERQAKGTLYANKEFNTKG